MSLVVEEVQQQITQIASRYPNRRSALLPALYVVQAAEGYVTPVGMAIIADVLGLTGAEVETVASFYSMYYQKPVGKNVIKVCTSISCYLRNCDKLLRHLSKRLQVARGETTADGRFTLLTAECLASCGTAPVIQVNNEFYENITLEKADELIDALVKESDAAGAMQPPAASNSLPEVKRT